MKPENETTARPTESAGTESPRPTKGKTAYVSLAERIRACDTPAAFNRVEAQCARHYEAGTITVSEFTRLDVLTMETRAKVEGITTSEMIEYSNSFHAKP